MQIPALHLCDFYKVDHRRQYPINTIKVYANFTPRKSRLAGIDSIIFFGLQYFMKEILINNFNETFFKKDKATVVAAYKRRVDNALGPNNMTYEHIEALHDLQYLPVLIKAIPEGFKVPMGVPVLTITNTIAEFFWLPNFLETILSTELWPGCTSATTAYNYRLIFDQFALKTVGNTDFSSTFQIHDFSMRGMMTHYAAALSGAAHLLCSNGTDSIPAIDFLEQYYKADSDKEIVGGSVPATEHSVMCMGMKDGELATFKRLITEVYPSGIVSIVSDTWNLWDVVKAGGILDTLKEDILAREGKVVIRPDSGDPVKILTGWNKDEMVEVNGQFYRPQDVDEINGGKETIVIEGRKPLLVEEVKGVIQCLWDLFEGEVNDLGYAVLDSHIGAIYGDSITLDRARQICQRLMDKGFASVNWVAGVGSYTYQYVTRDTFGFAMKATYGELLNEDGSIERREIFKDPITDDGTKKSARGLLHVAHEHDKDRRLVLKLIDQVSEEDEKSGQLLQVFENGVILREDSLHDVRWRANYFLGADVAVEMNDSEPSLV